MKVSLWIGLASILLTGCQSVPSEVGSFQDRMSAKASFLTWNMQSDSQRAVTSDLALVQLASMPKEQLDWLLDNCPSPSIGSIEGRWVGVNRGVLPTMAGASQFIKEFRICPSVQGTLGSGNNIVVQQVPMDDLACRGWIYKIDPETCNPKTIGNFGLICRRTLELDYAMSDHSRFDPTQFLVDELVQVDENLLLGRANMRFLRWRIPVSYFVLTRMAH